ncbi:hypothetical protein IT570_10010 [Candidatus Sumerlaeota bacterium]|nr:hypothetical protein [Candidatus Sumerlaeota bacterium]
MSLSEALADEFGPDPLPIDLIDQSRIVPSDPLVGATLVAAGEAELISLGSQIATDLYSAADGPTSSTASQEHALLNVAIRLRAEGTERSLPLLGRLASGTPRTMTHDVICRDIVPLALYPYPSAASEAAHQIRFRLASQRLAEKSARADFTWILEAPQGDADELAAVIAALKRVPHSELRNAAGRLSRDIGSRKLLRADQMLLAEICILTGIPPSALELKAMDDDIVITLMQRAREFGQRQHDLLKNAKTDPRLASLVELQSPAPAASIQDQLALGGASAAQRIARQASSSDVAELSRIAHDATQDVATRRHAIMALILIGSSDALASLRAIAADPGLPQALRDKVAARLP